jgi:hypothetical protein
MDDELREYFERLATFAMRQGGGPRAFRGALAAEAMRRRQRARRRLSGGRFVELSAAMNATAVASSCCCTKKGTMSEEREVGLPGGSRARRPRPIGQDAPRASPAQWKSTAQELKQILVRHRGWLANQSGSALPTETRDDYLERPPAYPNWLDEARSHPEQANLSGADLVDADLSNPELSITQLSDANLSAATLVRANLSNARLPLG